jgi:hypothetical protein
MIQLQIDTKLLVEELNNKLAGIKHMTAPTVLQEMGKGIFAITGERFVLATDNYSRRNPKKMHHVYEWGGVGQPSKRLFVIERASILGGNLIVNARFLPSKLPVPINPLMLSKSGSNRSVSRRSIFKDKATVMEEGRRVSFTAKRVLAFMGNDGIAFVAPGTQINIEHPGGMQTNNAFANFMLEWYTKNGAAIMDASGFYEKVAQEVSLALNVKGAGIAQVRTAVARASNLVTGGKEVIV